MSVKVCGWCLLFIPPVVWWGGASGEAVLTHVLPFLHIGARSDRWFLAQRITVKSPISRDLVAKSKGKLGKIYK